MNNFGLVLENCKNINNIGAIMRAAFNFNAQFIATIGKRYKRDALDTCNAEKHIPIFTFNSIDDYRKSAVSWIHVGCEIVEQSINIKNFVHPKQCVYLLGPEDGGLSKNALSICKYIVQIPTRNCLNLSVAAGILMYDRTIKQ